MSQADLGGIYKGVLANIYCTLAKLSRKFTNAGATGQADLFQGRFTVLRAPVVWDLSEASCIWCWKKCLYKFFFSWEEMLLAYMKLFIDFYKHLCVQLQLLGLGKKLLAFCILLLLYLKNVWDVLDLA